MNLYESRELFLKPYGLLFSKYMSQYTQGINSQECFPPH